MGSLVVPTYSGRKRRDLGGRLSHPVLAPGDRIAPRVRKHSASVVPRRGFDSHRPLIDDSIAFTPGNY
jgi:hypothetical protein